MKFMNEKNYEIFSGSAQDKENLCSEKLTLTQTCEINDTRSERIKLMNLINLEQNLLNERNILF